MSSSAIVELRAGLVPAAEAPAPTQRAEGRAATFVAMTTNHRLGVTIAMMFGLSMAIFVASVLELPLVAMALLASIVTACVGSSTRFGRWRLHRLEALLDEPAERKGAILALEALAEGPWRVQPIGVDARGWVALQRLEQGDLGGALLQARAIRLRSLPRERRRTPDAGFLGEVVSSVLGHLFPEAGLEVTPSASFRVDDESATARAPRRFEELLASLRLLELVDRGQRGPVLRAWNELDFDAMRRFAPVLCTLIWGAAARIVPELERGLAHAVHKLDARRRRLVLRRYPHLCDRGDAAYRVPARAVPRGSLPPAPTELVALSPLRQPSRWLPIAPRWTRAVGWVLVMQAIVSLAWLGEPVFVLTALAFTPLLAGSFHHRSIRVDPLRAAGITATPRLRELARMRTRTSSRHSDVGSLHPFERGEIMLIVGLHRAERALAEGDAEEARTHVLWWYGGADDGTVHRIDPVAIGGSLVRVAALLGMDDVASRLAQAFEPSTAWLDGLRRRTGHGDAPRALALARSLAHALAGRWYAAAHELAQAAEHPPIVLDRFERELYGVLVQRIAMRGHGVPASLRGLARPACPTWVEHVWPAQRH